MAVDLVLDGLGFDCDGHQTLLNLLN
jgi:hypothetical protein